MTELSATHRRAQRVLMMVGELHKRGYQRLRISPGLSPSGGYWRCNITSVDNIKPSHGALISKYEDVYVAQYTSGQDNHYFEWSDAANATARGLAELFIERFPQITERSRGRDWSYAGWFVEMLGTAERGYLPMAFNDWSDLTDAAMMPTTSADGLPDAPDLPRPPPPSSAAVGM